jgi:streptomycin 6-kinase
VERSAILRVPDNLARAIVEVFGQMGVMWLSGLPALVVRCEQRWSVRVLPPVESLSYNYIAMAVRADGTSVILKLGVPNPELLTEIAALRLYDGCGCVRLLDADPEGGALLLEHLKPGTPLSSLTDDAQATSIAVRVMQQLWRPVPPEHPFPTVARWAAGLQRLRDRFDGGTGPLPAAWVERAERLFSELLSSMDEPVLLHGDLHHFNILAAERLPWLAIDPKGIVGEPAYEIGALLRNPFPRILRDPRARQMSARRLDQLAAELGFDRGRLQDWAVAQAVLAAWWSYEDHGYGWEPWLACAELLVSL